MKKLSFTSLFVVLTIISFQLKGKIHSFKYVVQRNQTIKMDTVEIISKLKKGEKAYLYFYDHLQDLNMPIEFQDSMKVKIAFKDYLLLKDTEKQMMFPINKSERVYVVKDKNQTTLLTSDDNNRSKELAFIVPIILKHQDFFVYNQDLAYQDILNEIDKANITHPISEQYFNAIKKLLNVHHLINISPPNLKSYTAKKIAAIEKQKSIFYDETYLQNSDFRMALIGYARYLSRKSLNKPDEFKTKYEVIATHFKGAIKEFLQFFHLNHANSKNQNFNKYLQAFLKETQNQEYVTYLREKYLSTPTVNGTLVNEQNEIKTYSELLKQYQGNIIYIDYWASWCMPCRAEIPSLKKMLLDYKDKNVVFLALSMDENKMAWKKAMSAEALEEGSKNFLVTKNFESDLAKKFKIQSIPRYILIGKDGQIINDNAPRPSDPKIRQLLDELLRK